MIMELLILIFQIILSLVLVGIAIYSAIYFTQITKIERQFGLKLPGAFKKILGGLTMIPITVSLIVLIIIFAEIVLP